MLRRGQFEFASVLKGLTLCRLECQRNSRLESQGDGARVNPARMKVEAATSANVLLLGRSLFNPARFQFDFESTDCTAFALSGTAPDAHGAAVVEVEHL